MIKTPKQKDKRIILNLLFNASSKPPNEHESEHEEERAVCGCNVEVNPECIKRTIKYDEADVLQINIRYPCVKLKAIKNHEAVVSLKNLEKIEKKINKFYDGIVRNFMKYSEGILFKNAANEYIIKKTKNSDDDAEYSKPFRAFGAVMNYEVTYNRGSFLCIYFDANIYTGRGRGRITRMAHIWELPAGTLTPSKRFIDLNSENRKKICSHICNAIQSQTERGEEYYINADFENVYRHFKAKNMFITERGCNFFFPQNSLSPPECGIVSFIYS